MNLSDIKHILHCHLLLTKCGHCRVAAVKGTESLFLTVIFVPVVLTTCYVKLLKTTQSIY